MEPRSWFDEPGHDGRPGELHRDELARPTVLVVEDEPDIRDLLVLLLEQAGFACVGSGTAEDGLGQLREQQFDLVLADYSLPTRSAVWMLTQATQEGLLSTTPVLIVTAHPDPRGVDDFEIIRKPFDLDRLVDRVKQRLEQGPSRPAAGAPGRTAPKGRRGGNGHRNHDGRPPIELILYISAHSPRSATAVDNLKRAIARYRTSP